MGRCGPVEDGDGGSEAELHSALGHTPLPYSSALAARRSAIVLRILWGAAASQVPPAASRWAHLAARRATRRRIDEAVEEGREAHS